MNRLLLKLLISLTLFVVTIQAQSETTYLYGTVTNSSGDSPIPRATILLSGSSLGTHTDSLGHYELLIPKTNSITLKGSSLGYLSKSHNISVEQNDSIRIDFALDSSPAHIVGLSVTGSRESYQTFNEARPVTFVEAKEFQERDFSSTADLLREEPGVLVQKTTHGHGSPIIRGLIGKYVLLLYNGIRLNRPTFRFGANQYLNTLDQSWLSTIAVNRGPSSVLYGSDAMGGAINLISYSPRFTHDGTDVTTKVNSRYSSADNGYAINGRLSASSKRLSGWAGLTYKKIGDLRGGGNIGQQRPTGFDEIDFIGQLNYLIGHNRLSAEYLGASQTEVPRYDKYECGDFEQFIYDPQDRQMFILSLQNLDGDGGRLTTSRIGLSYSIEHEGRTEQKLGSPVIESSSQKLTTWGGFGQWTTAPVKDHRLTIGSDYYYDLVHGDRFRTENGLATVIRPTYPDGSTYHSFGLYAEYAWPISNRWELTPGLRYSRVTLGTNLEEYGEQHEVYSNLTGSFSALYYLSDNYNILTRWSRGFRAPNLNDVASLKTSSSGVDAPSPGLTPETTDNFEIGFRSDLEGATGAIYLYYNSLHNLIDRRPGLYQDLSFLDTDSNDVQDAGEADIFVKENVGEAYIWGVELDGRFALNQNWDMRFNIFYTRGQNITDDQPMSRIPPFMGSLAVRHQLSKSSWTELLVRAAGDQTLLSDRDIDDCRIEPGGTIGWGSLNLRSGTNWNGLDLILMLQNLTDSKYKEHGSGIYSAGRGLMLSITYGSN